ncbi:CMP-5'-phosphonoformate--3-phosphoglycerate phosphonoformyl transferase [Streptosporangium sp. NBC_01495]|uniref:CMP-5'-phosphonoformate--3-phosphoglycerate phosphonoformyl transferase n=1 Tax=Streptosporangium sp. NBC_01495 TaxID=2903899 RepID=UPI002E3516C0|nr:CMP-5'-phosphonoformate--3-phosphoglycerate phosphonoformyl transferase [Streptosporangium sp. NBC_01495]
MSASGKLYLIALCGGGDRPTETLGGRTPFEAAFTPHLDRLAADGRNGLLEIIGEDIPPESDSGAMALLGYDPAVYYTGRGPLEGYGNRYWDPEGYSVAFRINFASLNQATGRLDRRTSRDLTDEEMQRLVTEIVERVRLDPDIDVRLTGWGRHRGILAFTSRTRPLSGEVSNTDPGFVKKGPFGMPVREHSNRPLSAEAMVDDGAARLVASLVNTFVEQSAKVLEASEINARRIAEGRKPANILLVRDGGHLLPNLPPATARISMYGQVPAERGLARLIGAEFTTAKVAPGQAESDFYTRLLPLLLADPADVVFAHIKGPDEPGHDNQPEEKVRAIADIDAHLVGPLRAALGPADVLVVTCDHATPCAAGIHTADHVPLAVVGPGVAPDAVAEFGEAAASRGDLPVRRASELMPWLARVRGRG